MASKGVKVRVGTGRIANDRSIRLSDISIPSLGADSENNKLHIQQNRESFLTSKVKDGLNQSEIYLPKPVELKQETLGVSGKRSGVEVKSNVNRDSHGLEVLEDFWTSSSLQKQDEIKRQKSPGLESTRTLRSTRRAAKLETKADLPKTVVVKSEPITDTKSLNILSGDVKPKSYVQVGLFSKAAKFSVSRTDPINDRNATFRIADSKGAFFEDVKSNSELSSTEGETEVSSSDDDGVADNYSEAEAPEVGQEIIDQTREEHAEEFSLSKLSPGKSFSKRVASRKSAIVKRELDEQMLSPFKPSPHVEYGSDNIEDTGFPESLADVDYESEVDSTLDNRKSKRVKEEIVAKTETLKPKSRYGQISPTSNHDRFSTSSKDEDDRVAMRSGYEKKPSQKRRRQVEDSDALSYSSLDSGPYHKAVEHNSDVDDGRSDYSLAGDSDDSEDEDNYPTIYEKMLQAEDEKVNLNRYDISPLPRKARHDDRSLRRSKRTRYPRLDHWRGERILYERRFNSAGQRVDIASMAGKPEIMKTPTPIKFPVYGKRSGNAMSRNDKEKVISRSFGRNGTESLPPPKIPKTLKISSPDSPIYTVDPDMPNATGNVVVMKKYEKVKRLGIPGDEGWSSTSNSMKPSAGAAFNDSKFISGFMNIPPNANKRSEDSLDYAQVFTVVESQNGALAVTISDKTYLADSKTQFWVPPRSNYTLRNFSQSVEAQLHFVLIRPTNDEI